MKSHSHEYDLKLFQNSGEESAPSHVASSSLRTSRKKLNSPLSPSYFIGYAGFLWVFFSRFLLTHEKKSSGTKTEVFRSTKIGSLAHFFIGVKYA